MAPFFGEIISNGPAGGGMAKLVVSAAPAFEEGVRPGQFGHIRPPNAPDLLLRRPISIMDADSDNRTLTFCIQPRGRGTGLICALRAGDKLELIAPLGRGFSLGEAKNVWLIGGGIGAAPMVYAAKCFGKSAAVTAIIGARSAEGVVAKGDFERLCAGCVICTENGSAGIGGTVVDGARSLGGRPDLICACGPTPMLKAVRAFALQNGIPCQLSLEQRMGCGYGACLTCSCKTRDKDGNEGFSRVCADGPVFDAREVVV